MGLHMRQNKKTYAIQAYSTVEQIGSERDKVGYADACAALAPRSVQPLAPQPATLATAAHRAASAPGAVPEKQKAGAKGMQLSREGSRESCIASSESTAASSVWDS